MRSRCRRGASIGGSVDGGIAPLLDDSRGCRATTGRSAAEAVRRHVRECDDAPDVLILDVGPRSLAHGLEDALSVREEFNVDIPVLLISAETSADEPEVTEEGIRVLRGPCAPARLRLELTALAASGTTAAAYGAPR